MDQADPANDAPGRPAIAPILEDFFLNPASDAGRLRTTLHAIPQKVWSARPDGHHDFYNDRWHEFTGIGPGSTDGPRWIDLLHPDDQERAWRIWNHSLATGEPYEMELRLRHHSGKYRWMLGRAVPTRDAHGAIMRWFGTFTDIDELKSTEEARELIAYELSHRIRNVFAVVSSLISLSTKDYPEADPFAQVILERIGALARAHDYVRSHRPEAELRGAENLHGLLETLVAPYNSGGESRILITGDEAQVGVHAATALSLIVHELGTNAIKYGALSCPGGQVHICCECIDDRFFLNWREQGGPSLAGPPTRQGFGSMMAKRAAKAQLDATLVEEWRREGLQLCLSMPKQNLRK